LGKDKTKWFQTKTGDLDIRKIRCAFFLVLVVFGFIIRVVKQWNRLPTEMVDGPSIPEDGQGQARQGSEQPDLAVDVLTLQGSRTR